MDVERGGMGGGGGGGQLIFGFPHRGGIWGQLSAIGDNGYGSDTSVSPVAWRPERFIDRFACSSDSIGQWRHEVVGLVEGDGK